MNRVLTASVIALALAGCQTLGGSSSSSPAAGSTNAASAPVPTMETAGQVSAQIMGCLDKARGAWSKEQQVVRLRLRLFAEDDGRITRWESADPLRYENDMVYKAAADAGGAALLHPACGKISVPSDQRASWRSFIFAAAPYEAPQKK